MVLERTRLGRMFANVPQTDKTPTNAKIYFPPCSARFTQTSETISGPFVPVLINAKNEHVATDSTIRFSAATHNFRYRSAAAFDVNVY